MRKRLQLALMLTEGTTIATSFPISRAWAAEIDSPGHGITATEEHGRKIYVDEDAPAKPRAIATQPRPRNHCNRGTRPQDLCGRRRSCQASGDRNLTVEALGIGVLEQQ